MFRSCSWSKAILFPPMAGIFMLLSACGSPSPPAADAVGGPGPSKAEAADKKGGQLAANSNFREWENQKPKCWTPFPADKIVKTAGAEPGSVAVELSPSGTDKHTSLRQNLSENIAGESITLKFRAKSSEPKMLSAKLNYETASGPQTVALDAEGSGAWESVTKTVKVPADAKAGSGALNIILRSGAKASAFVEYLTVEAK